MKSSADFLAQAEGSADLRKKLGGAGSANDLVKLASDSGFDADKSGLSAAMRSVAGAELRKRGFPEWAIDSVFLGDAVCW
jgi:hypothetical protein